MEGSTRKILIIGGIVVTLIIIMTAIMDIMPVTSDSEPKSLNIAKPAESIVPETTPKLPVGAVVNTARCPSEKWTEFVRNHMDIYRAGKPHKAVYMHNNCGGLYYYLGKSDSQAAFDSTKRAATNAWGEQNIHLRDIDGDFI